MKIYLKKIKLTSNSEDEENDDLIEDMDEDNSKGSDDDFDEDEVIKFAFFILLSLPMLEIFQRQKLQYT